MARTSDRTEYSANEGDFFVIFRKMDMYNYSSNAIATFCLFLGGMLLAGCQSEKQKNAEDNKKYYRELMATCRYYETAQPVGLVSTTYTANDYFPDSQVADLAQAARKEDLKQIDLLIEKGVDVNTRGLMGVTPLMYSISGGLTKGFTHLLEKGAKPNQQTDWGDSAITLAAANKNSEFLKNAIEHGGNPNIRSSSEKAGFTHNSHPTPIYEAIRDRNPENARILIKAGAEIEARDSEDRTPLMAACVHRSFDVMYVLLESGADFRAIDPSGYSVSYYILDCNIDPDSEIAKSRQKCMDFMAKNGIDFEPDKKKIEEKARQTKENYGNSSPEHWPPGGPTQWEGRE